MTGQHIVIVGSGELAGSICGPLASLAAQPIRVTVLARNVAAAQAASAGRFHTERLGDDVEDTLDRLRPDILVCCASAQSPYEKVEHPSAWTQLVEEAGFGITLSLQTLLAVQLARALVKVSPHTLFINACFPDAVNPLLSSLDLPVLCGIGNVATIATCLQTALNLPDQRRLAVLGHHVHLSEGPEEVQAWLDGVPLPGITGLLKADRARPRRSLNAIAGLAAARLVADMTTGSDVYTNVPGPLGLSGGYPVKLAGGVITLNLPSGLSPAEAIEWNSRVGRDDGLEIREGWVSHTPRAAAALTPHLPDLAKGWSATSLDEVSNQFLELRGRLQLVPKGPRNP